MQKFPITDKRIWKIDKKNLRTEEAFDIFKVSASILPVSNVRLEFIL